MIKKSMFSHKNFKTSIKSCVSIKKVHRVTKFSPKAWLKPCIDMNTELRKRSKK